MSAMLPDWTTACPDWEKRIVRRESLIPCKPLFPEVADLALNTFKQLALVDVVGDFEDEEGNPRPPLISEVTKEWVYEFVASIFGAYDPGRKRRLIREFFLLISKKNTKSTIAAAIMLTALILNDRPSAELIILAPTKEVADNSFGPIRDMIKADPELADMMRLSEHTRTVTHEGTGAILKVVAADSDATAGKKASWILVDELWVFGKRANAESMLREATGGLASRPEGCIIYLTTQSDEIPAGVFKQKLDYARAIRDGRKVNKQFLPLIYEFPLRMLDKRKHYNLDWWYVTNPNLGASVDMDFLRNQWEQVQENGEESIRDFLAKHLNVEIGMNLRADRWAGADFWEKQGKKFELDFLIKKSDCITIGFDGGGLDDLFGMTVLGRDAKDRSIWYLWTKAWVHPIALQRRKEIAPRLRDFEKQGDLVIVKNIGEDVTEAGEIAKKGFDTGKMPEKAFGLDKLGMPALQDGLIDAGIPFESLFAIPQGYMLSGYATTAERKLAEKKLFHADQPLMTWCVGNAKGKRSGNAVIITKQESGVCKIDPVISMFNAVALMSLNQEPNGGRMTDEQFMDAISNPIIV
ncbi:phage Terminase family protein [Acinetobacter baumannii 923118]|uniref:terminase large subunit n=1 Tax=Acinetobacter baumannii TaxID=470 RepID=UPI000449BF4C|nr:terminase large subunit [Acinetobacter baumannii]EXI43322.1 phage Terminase family protein [Acinetobacter baumannii 923118]